MVSIIVTNKNNFESYDFVIASIYNDDGGGQYGYDGDADDEETSDNDDSEDVSGCQDGDESHKGHVKVRVKLKNMLIGFFLV